MAARKSPPTQLGRRKFLRIGGLGAAALAAGAAGRAEVAPETAVSGQAGQAPPLLETNLVIPFLKTDRREWKRDADYLDSAGMLYARGQIGRAHV